MWAEAELNRQNCIRQVLLYSETEKIEELVKDLPKNHPYTSELQEWLENERKRKSEKEKQQAATLEVAELLQSNDEMKAQEISVSSSEIGIGDQSNKALCDPEQDRVLIDLNNINQEIEPTFATSADITDINENEPLPSKSQQIEETDIQFNCEEAGVVNADNSKRNNC